MNKIKDLNIAEDYKKTTLGYLPKDWRVCKMSDVGEIFGGFAFKSIDFLSEPLDNTLQVLKMGNVKMGRLDLDNNPSYLIKDNLLDNEHKYILSEGDVLISLTGTIGKTDYGNIAFVDNNNSYLLNQRVACFREKSSNQKKGFYYYYMQSSLFRNRFFLLGVGGTGNQANVSIKELSNLQVIFPSLSEQQKIANILSTWDKAIELKEKLIEQKKDQKKGLMQKLLTGDVRLPGFEDKWRKIKIGNLIKEVNEKSTKNNQYEVLSVTKNGIVSQKEQFKKQVASEDNVGYKIIKRNNLVFSTMNLWMGSLDVLTTQEIGIVSPAYKVFEFFNDNIIPSFAKYFMVSEHMIWLYNVNSEQGASIVRRNLDLKGLLNTVIKIPSIQEQHNIANVLLSIDKEIDLLKDELLLLKQQKKGLMLQLLTGKVRVKV